MGKLPALSLGLAPTRTTLSSSSRLSSSPISHQIRYATFIPRPRRPYTFTQLIQLSDGSTYTARTTSPLPLYRASKDTRNTLLWQPSEKSLRNVELDEAGKLAAFRERFGRDFDATGAATAEGGDADATTAAAAAPAVEDSGLNFEDLLAEYAPQDTSALKDSGPKKAPVRRK